MVNYACNLSEKELWACKTFRIYMFVYGKTLREHRVTIRLHIDER